MAKLTEEELAEIDLFQAGDTSDSPGYHRAKLLRAHIDAIEAERDALAGALRPVKCGQCAGTGKVNRQRYSEGGTYESNCPTCKGHGEVVPILTLDECRRLAAATQEKQG